MDRRTLYKSKYTINNHEGETYGVSVGARVLYIVAKEKRMQKNILSYCELNRYLPEIERIIFMSNKETKLTESMMGSVSDTWFCK